MRVVIANANGESTNRRRHCRQVGRCSAHRLRVPLRLHTKGGRASADAGTGSRWCSSPKQEAFRHKHIADPKRSRRLDHQPNAQGEPARRKCEEGLIASDVGDPLGCRDASLATEGTDGARNEPLKGSARCNSGGRCCIGGNRCPGGGGRGGGRRHRRYCDDGGGQRRPSGAASGIVERTGTALGQGASVGQAIKTWPQPARHR